MYKCLPSYLGWVVQPSNLSLPTCVEVALGYDNKLYVRGFVIYANYKLTACIISR
jgi:hypothetical protein